MIYKLKNSILNILKESRESNRKTNKKKGNSTKGWKNNLLISKNN